MDIWLDTTDIQLVHKAVKLGIVAGVTTNPSLIAKANRNQEEIVDDLLHAQEGPVAIQVLATDMEEMVQQGQMLYSLSNRLIIKIPLTQEGIESIHLLSRQGIPTMATAIFHPRQALLAALAGANYVAPYISRIEKIGENPWKVLQSISHIFHSYRMKTKILGASLQTIDHLLQCAECGISGVTVHKELFDKFVESEEHTLQAVQQFSLEGEKYPFLFAVK